ncbi:MAG: class I SAM-dependent methyltransferase [Candidatus Thiodiazotropha sp. (ex Ctena orbiculata)]|uniref:Class I SAM-dependent methyltransferase n=1 Tax=Candidatus Thiodiazotropha taylori TaxID=2792791 RepID=A0A944M9S4_9GAMM|nr:class I SAM-dependent methyltransferase [Candidatus Thiodiazotropha taylori]MBV2135678.1 class I SAM-dependent methyltransferase [Candidatus Thiodiazotropha taylori]
MRICTFCDTRYDNKGWQCPECQASPANIEGFPVLAEALAQANSGYNIEHFAKLAPLEASNFWFRSRNRLLIWALQKHFPEMGNLFEIGCGTGYVLSGIERAFPKVKLSASDIYTAGLKFTKGRVDRADLFQMDARNIPFDSEFDVIGAFDVLEHIVEDHQVLSEMYRAVKPGGGIVLTVPQHQFLWSQTDVRACHVRRYSAVELKDKVEEAGFSIKMSTSFVSLLLPLMMISRSRIRKIDNCDQTAELMVGCVTNWILEKILDLERILIRGGLYFSAGGSLLLIAEK